MRIGILGVCVTLALASAVQAADYRFTATTDDSVLVIDRDTLQAVPSGATRVMMSTIYKPQAAARTGAALMIDLWEFDCADLRYKVLFGKAYDAKGLFVGDVNPTPYQYIGKGTAAESAARDVCDVSVGSRAPALNAVSIANLMELALDRYRH